VSCLILKDGTGKGYNAKVSADNRVLTESVTLSKAADVSENDGKTFSVVTGNFVSVTSGESAILYMKYTGEKKLFIETIRTCGTGVQKWLLYKGTNAGTIVSNATAAVSTNMNFTSNNVPQFTAYKGADGNTESGGSVFENWINNGGHSIEDFNDALILGKNDTLCLTCTAAASIDVCVRLLCFEGEE
jgi:hypothetical protein